MDNSKKIILPEIKIKKIILEKPKKKRVVTNTKCWGSAIKELENLESTTVENMIETGEKIKTNTFTTNKVQDKWLFFTR